MTRSWFLPWGHSGQSHAALYNAAWSGFFTNLDEVLLRRFGDRRHQGAHLRRVPDRLDLQAAVDDLLLDRLQTGPDIVRNVLGVKQMYRVIRQLDRIAVRAEFVGLQIIDHGRIDRHQVPNNG